MPPFIQCRQPPDDSWVTFDLAVASTIYVRQPPDDRWVPFTIGGGGGGVPPGVNPGDILIWNGFAWVPVPEPLPLGTVDGQLLQWYTAAWYARTTDEVVIPPALLTGDFGAALQTFIPAEVAGLNRTIIVPPGSYTAATTCSLTTASSGAHVKFADGVSVTRQGEIALLTLGSVDETLATYPYALAANVTKGDIAITVTSSIGLVEGDWLRIGPGGNIAAPWYGRYELLRIRSIAGNIITLEWEVQDQYLTTTPAGILKFDPPHDIILDFGNAHFSGDVFGRTREIVINSALDVTINGGHWDESAGGLQTFVLTFAYAATRCQASKTHVINHKCALFGTVDLTTLSYPADFGTKTLSIKCDATTTVVTFANPASPIAAIAEINAALGVLGNASLGSGNILLVVADNDVVVTDGTLLAATVGMTSTAHGQVAGWLLLEGGKTCTIDKSVLDGPSLQVEVCFEATITEPHIVSRDPIYSALVLRDPDQVTINGGHCESAGRGHGVELPNNPTTTVVIRGTRMIGAPVSGTAGLWGFGRVCHVSIFGVEAIGYSYGVNIGTGAPNQNQMFYAEDTVAETIDVNGYCWYSQAPEVTKAHLVRCTARRLGGAPGFVGFAGAMLVEEPTVNNLTIGFGTAAGQKMIVRRISSTSSVVDYWFLIAQTIIVQDSNIVANGATVAFKGWNTPNLLDLQNVIVTGTGVGISGTLFGVVTRIDGQSAILTSTVENGTPTQWSRGNATPYSASIFTGTGAPAAVAFSDLRAGEAPKFTALTGAGVMPLIALTPGTGFTANAPLGATYVWEM